MKILCVGEASFNITLPVDKFIKENEQVKITDKKASGGANIYKAATLLASFGLDTYLAASIGNDYYGNFLKEELKEKKVNTKYLYQDNDKETSSSYIITSKENGSRTVLKTQTKDLKYKEILKLDESFDYVLIDGYDIDASLDAIKQNEDAKIILDASSKNDGAIKLARKADYIVASKDFAESFTGKTIDLSDFKTLIEVYNDIKDAFKKAHLIIVLNDGSSFTYQDGYKLIPSIKSSKVFSGAFDIYLGSLLYFIAKGEDLLIAMRKASIAGALSREEEKIPLLETINQRFNENK